MIVRVFATLRQVIGSKTIEVARSDGTTIRHVLDEVVARYPAMGAELFNDKGQLHNYVHVFVNGRDVRYLEHLLETPIREQDEVELFPAVGGGLVR
ncbi:MAG: MoaD/ThiS family protein [Thermoflexales bacterium]|nr:MoaD/ThiS family protein [Thermoflexales bacterium]